MIAIRIHLFARARDLAGCATLEWLVEPGTTVGQLRALLLERVPALEPILARCAVAVSREFADADLVLPANAEVAILPPVSGGAE